MIAKKSELSAGLYLVATPIGNARDITLRALDVLVSADVLAAEDTRTLRKLMEIHGLSLGDRPCLAYHDHSSEGTRAKILERINAGQSVAYASEAGTPLVADPGFKLAKDAREANLQVTALPGASAVLAAIMVAGLPSDRFTFAGFSPVAEGARKKFLEGFTSEAGTLIFYESPRRTEKFLATAAKVFGPECGAAICRELTKKFEEVNRGTLAQLCESPGVLKGEVVIVIGPRTPVSVSEGEDMDAVLSAAMKRLSIKDASAEVAEIYGLKKRDVYQRALALKDDE